MTGQVYGAPWSTSVKLTTVTSLGVFFGALYLVATGLAGIPWLRFSVIAGLVLLVLVSLWSTIRGYELRGRTLIVYRLGRETHVELSGSTVAEFDPGAMKWSFRVFGNGGFFSLTGLWWNRKLGRFRAYATDPKRTVVLRSGRKTIVVSPDRPAEFVAAVRESLH